MYTCKTGDFSNEDLCLCFLVKKSMYTFKTENFGREHLCFLFVFFYRVCTNTTPVILEKHICVYVCFVVGGMCICKTGNFGNEPLSL